MSENKKKYIINIKSDSTKNDNQITKKNIIIDNNLSYQDSIAQVLHFG